MQPIISTYCDVMRLTVSTYCDIMLPCQHCQDIKRGKTCPAKKPDLSSRRDGEHKPEKPVSNGIGSSRSPVQEHADSSGTGFRPVYLTNSAQPCQCSACVGAMAATITKVCVCLCVCVCVCVCV